MTTHPRLLLAAASLAAILVLEATPAAAQPAAACQPGDRICARVDVRVPARRVRILTPQRYRVWPWSRWRTRHVTLPPPAPMPAQVVYQPPPPPGRVIVTPAPPPQPVAPPPPVQTQTVVVIEQQQVVTYAPARRAMPHHRHGVSLRLAGVSAGDRGSLGGMLAAYRFRPVPQFALEFGTGIIGGEDDQGGRRIETPLTVDGLVFFNTRRRLQPYLLLGLGVSSARVDRTGDFVDGFGDEVDYRYFGGQAGIGLEWRFLPHLAANLDLRGFVRTRIDDEPGAEFVRETADGEIQTTDTSGGALFTLGLTASF